ncbi:hypothetical protein SJ05684_c12370 [Sinorhizobium sojae CCBAU 05684]|uniref:Uncharacterized protein n=1 Tax=Sinorhizobium sojae CCBAU 05684 TaxID=716928 RepID=A0A249PA98_9HYPH|nr:hypothetical protein SJ05684_c12370 [Sinorhizobium sojae CCBAU 05684]
MARLVAKKTRPVPGTIGTGLGLGRDGEKGLTEARKEVPSPVAVASASARSSMRRFKELR